MENHSEFTEPNQKELEQNSNIYDEVFLNHSFLVDFFQPKPTFWTPGIRGFVYIIYLFPFPKEAPPFGFQTFVFSGMCGWMVPGIVRKRLGANEL